MVTATVPFLLLIILLIKFIGLNNEVDGNGPGFYLGTQKINVPVPNDTNIVFEEYDPTEETGTIF